MHTIARELAFPSALLATALLCGVKGACETAERDALQLMSAVKQEAAETTIAPSVASEQSTVDVTPMVVPPDREERAEMKPAHPRHVAALR